MTWTSLFLTVSFIAGWAIVLRVLIRPRMEPSVRVAWIMVVQAVPFVGILAYLLFGEVRLAHTDHQRGADIRKKLLSIWMSSPSIVQDPPEWMAPVTATVTAIGGMVPVSGNRISLLSETDDVFDEMIAAIDGANNHVHILFYIWLNDTSGRRIADALCRAAGRGVTCRIIVDAVGSRSFIRSAVWTQMARCGIELIQAMPTGLSPLRALSSRLDLRNHRKIVLIDNKTGFTGSRNAADTAFSIKPRFAPWVDVWFSIEGPVVRQMQGVFLADWMSYTGSNLADEVLHIIPAVVEPGVIGQVLATGPDRQAGNIADCMIAMLASARHYVTITTPYYVPISALDRAIQACARRGVEVTLILPERNDSLLVKAASEGFYQGLLCSGVRVMLFRPGLLHAKLVTVDGRIAMIGSGNLDRRSFELNYEMNLIIADHTLIKEIDNRQSSYIDRSRRLYLSEVESWSFWRRFRNNLFALATPLL